MGISIRPDDIQDLAGLLNDVRAARKAYPQDATQIDAKLAEHTGGRFPTFSALSRAVRNLNTTAYAARTNAKPGQIVADAVQQIGQTNRNAPSPQLAAAMARERGQQNSLDGQALGRAALRGATFNFDDNLARLAGVGQGPGGMYSPEGQANFAEFEQQNPIASGAANMLGSLPTGGLLGSLAKRGIASVAARQAAKLVPGAELAPTVAQVLNAQGALPNTIRAAGVGGLYGGANALGDGRPAAEVVGAAALGAGAGTVLAGTLPLLRTVKRAFTDGGAREASMLAQRIGNVNATQSATGAVQSAEPLSLGTRIGDALVPQRAVDRAGRGLSRMDAERQTYEAAGMGQGLTPADMDPTDGRIVSTALNNALRGNPDASGMSSVQALAARPVNTNAVMQEGIDAAQGVSRGPLELAGPARTAPLPIRNVADEQLGRPAALVAESTAQLRGAPYVQSPTSPTGFVPSTSGFDGAKRIAQMENIRETWAASRAGYGGLRPTGVRPDPTALDEAMGTLQQSIQNINADPAALSGVGRVLNNLQAVRGGISGTAPLDLENVKQAVRAVTEVIDDASLSSRAPGFVSLTGPQLEQAKAARKALIDYADQSFTHKGGETFSSLSQKYAVLSQQERDVAIGSGLYRGILPNGKALGENDATAAIQVLNALPASSRTNANVGIISDVLNEFRGADVNDVGALTRNLLVRSGGAYRKSELLKAAFPSQREFQQVVMKQALFDAADRGYEAFASMSAAQLQSALRKLSPSARREFQSTMTQRMRDELADPVGAHNAVIAMAKDVRRGPNGESSPGSVYMAKFREMFGDEGAKTMRDRVLLADRRNEVSDLAATAAGNTAQSQRSPVVVATAQSGNASNLATIATGIVRKLAGRELNQAERTELARLLSEEGGQSFRDAVQRNVAPSRNSGRAGLLASALAGRSLQSLLATGSDR